MLEKNNKKMIQEITILENVRFLILQGRNLQH